MILNTVELRVTAISIAKEYVKDAKSLIDEAKKIEKYIKGNATIPDVVEDPSSSWVKSFGEITKNSMPKLPDFPDIPIVADNK